MKKSWSSKWVSSIQPRKQRKYRCNAPLHTRRKFLSVHLSPELRKRFGTRSLPVRKGDEVKVLVGSFRGFKGLVDRTDIKKSKVFVDGVKVKKPDGSEVLRAVQPSNLMLTNVNLDDKMRQKVLDRKGKRPSKTKEARK